MELTWWTVVVAVQLVRSGLIWVLYGWHPHVGSTHGKELACQFRRLRDVGSIPGSERSPGGGHGSPLQYSCLESSMDRGAWRATVHSVAVSQTRLKRLSTQYIVGDMDRACDQFNLRKREVSRMTPGFLAWAVVQMAVIFHIEGDKIPFVPVSFRTCCLSIKLRGQKLIRHGGGLRMFLYKIPSVAAEQKNLT